MGSLLLRLALFGCALALAGTARAQDEDTKAWVSVDGHLSGDTLVVSQGGTFPVSVRFGAVNAAGLRCNIWSPPENVTTTGAGYFDNGGGFLPVMGGSGEVRRDFALTAGDWYFWTDASDGVASEVSSGPWTDGLLLHVRVRVGGDSVLLGESSPAGSMARPADSADLKNDFLVPSPGLSWSRTDGSALGRPFDPAGGRLFPDGLPVSLSIYATPYAIITLCGTPGVYGYTDGPLAVAQFAGPWGVAVDVAGNLYVADSGNNAIRKITPGGAVTTVISGGGLYGLNDPTGVAVDAAGNIYIANRNNYAIWKVTPAGVMTILAGLSTVPGSADGTGSFATFSSPTGVAVDGSGNVYVADSGNNTIRKITAGGVVTTLAGRAGQPGAVDGTGTAARFDYPAGVAVDQSGNVYVADTFGRAIRKITPGGVVTTLAGELGAGGHVDGTGSAAQFSEPSSVALDASGNVYVVDSDSTVRKVTPGGVVTTLAGAAGFSSYTDGAGAAARFNEPQGIAVAGNGTLYVADTLNHVIRLGNLIVAPAISAQPQSTSVLAGAAFSLSVGATGTAPLTYQWYQNGNAVAGATASTYAVASAATTNAGSYTVIVSNPAGSATSNSAVVAVSLPVVAPSIAIQPQSITITAGQGGNLSVAANGTAPLSYQWFQNGNAVAGATSSTYAISNAVTANAGSYTVTVTNSAGTATSAPATVVVGIPPSITSPPQSVTVAQGSLFTLSVTCAGSDPISYQWSFNGGAISGATGSSYVVASASPASAGSYAVTATNAFGTATSGAAAVIVNVPSAPAASGSGGGGGGAPSAWFYGALLALVLARHCVRPNRTGPQET
jgi:sugar lactone lactonase YvrE